MVTLGEQRLAGNPTRTVRIKPNLKVLRIQVRSVFGILGFSIIFPITFCPWGSPALGAMRHGENTFCRLVVDAYYSGSYQTTGHLAIHFAIICGHFCPKLNCLANVFWEGGRPITLFELDYSLTGQPLV